MKWTARIISLVFVGLSSAASISYYYVQHNVIDSFYIVMSVVYMGSGYWLGRQYDKVKFLSVIDSLTNSYNRRFAIQTFPKLATLSERKGKKLLLYLIDVNQFKMINDHYGHMMGDHVLQLISVTIHSLIGKSDYIVRWGGDEFLVIRSYTTEAEEDVFPAKLHRALQELSLTISMNVSVSIGTAIYPDEGAILEELIRLADHNMYQQKQK